MSSFIETFNIFSERNTGSNYLEQLILANLDIKFKSLGWKHGYPNVNADELERHLCIVIFRNPYDWISSFAKTRHHCEWTIRLKPFSSFIRSEWSANDEQDNDINSEFYPQSYFPELNYRKKFENPLKLRTTKTKEHLKFVNSDIVKHMLIVRYEDVISDPLKTIEHISNSFNIGRKGPFINIDIICKTPHQKWQKRNYRLSNEDMVFINSQLDWDLENKLGYTMQNASDNIVYEQDDSEIVTSTNQSAYVDSNGDEQIYGAIVFAIVFILLCILLFLLLMFVNA